MHDDALARLAPLLPAGRVITDPEVMEPASRDQARFVPAGSPAALVRPRTTGEVQAVVQWASEHDIAVVPRGAGSGLAGGANAVDGCVLLGLDQMTRIVEIDPANRLAVVEPGVITAALDDAARERGLFYPPDPASKDMSTIGGNIATNAGGLCCVKYGVTADYVLGLEVVLGDGRVIRTGRRTRKGVAGYDLTRLLVGSEGTLGIVTEATLRLRPAPPRPATLVASFAALEAAGVAVTEIVSVVVPSLLEIMDRTTIAAVEAYKPVGLESGTEALLLAQSDSGDQKEELDLVQSACERAGATFVVRSSDPAEAELLLNARRMVFWALEAQGDIMPEDVAVPPSRLPALLRDIAAIAHRHGVVVATFGHAGDGNMHPSIIHDASDEASSRAANEAFADIVAAALAHGGTMTGEHGVGLLKRRFLPDEIGADALDVMRAVKRTLDPKGILNPGKAL